MSGIAKNLMIVLGLITVAFAGYYMYTQRTATVLTTGTSNQVVEDMLANTQVFIERRQALDRVTLDMSIFEDERFRSLRSFSEPLDDIPVGRANPFAEAGQDFTNTPIE